MFSCLVQVDLLSKMYPFKLLLHRLKFILNILNTFIITILRIFFFIKISLIILKYYIFSFPLFLVTYVLQLQLQLFFLIIIFYCVQTEQQTVLSVTFAETGALTDSDSTLTWRILFRKIDFSDDQFAKVTLVSWREL